MSKNGGRRADLLGQLECRQTAPGTWLVEGWSVQQVHNREYWNATPPQGGRPLKFGSLTQALDWIAG